MGKKSTNYEILDKLLQDADQPARKSSMTSEEIAEGLWVTDRETFDELYKSVDQAEKRLRS